MTLATSADVAALLAREIDTAETAMIDRRLAQVERMLLRRIPDLLQIADGDLLADVIDIEAEAVLRVVRNPEGLRAENDGTYGYQLSREAADNRLRILPEEWERLGIKPSRMFSIVPNLVAPQGAAPFGSGG